MRTSLLISALLAAATVPSLAHASCHDRKVTGAVGGAVGGGLIGGLVSHSVPWGFVGAGAGALIGHTIAGATCHDHYAYYGHYHHYRHAYYHHHYYHEGYYEPAGYSAAGAGGAYAQRCVTRVDNYYDAHGNLVQRQNRVCS